jgi:hypothetical protein
MPAFSLFVGMCSTSVSWPVLIGVHPRASAAKGLLSFLLASNRACAVNFA